MNNEMWDQVRLFMSTPFGAQVLKQTMAEFLDDETVQRRQDGGLSEKAIIIARANKIKAQQAVSETSAIREMFASILRRLAWLRNRGAEMNQ